MSRGGFESLELRTPFDEYGILRIHCGDDFKSPVCLSHPLKTPNQAENPYGADPYRNPKKDHNLYSNHLLTFEKPQPSETQPFREDDASGLRVLDRFPRACNKVAEAPESEKERPIERERERYIYIYTHIHTHTYMYVYIYICIYRLQVKGLGLEGYPRRRVYGVLQPGVLQRYGALKPESPAASLNTKHPCPVTGLLDTSNGFIQEPDCDRVSSPYSNC